MSLLSTTRTFETQRYYAVHKHGHHTLLTRSIRFCSYGNFGRRVGLESSMDTSCCRTRNQVNSVSSTLVNSRFRDSVPLIAIERCMCMHHRSFSSSFRSKRNECTRAASSPGVTSGSGFHVGDLGYKVKDGWQVVMDANPYLKSVIVSIGYTLAGIALAWFGMPRVLRMCHKYAVKGPAASVLVGDIPYEKSIWGALEDPVRYLITFMAFLQIGMKVAPTTIAANQIAPAWKSAIILSFVWVLYRWKTNALGRTLTSESLDGLNNRNNLVTLDIVTSLGLFALGIMALAESWGVSVQSIQTVGSIGGVAIAFGAKDVLGNVLSGLSMLFSKPFSLGDTIKAGSIQGKVVEMRLTTTSLLNTEKFPVIVPNSLFSGQAIVIESPAQSHALVTKIPIQIKMLDKIPEISEDIKTMLKSNTKVFLDKELPYCFLSRIDSSFVELTLGYNLKLMSKGELCNAQQEILLRSVEIIKKHGGSVGMLV